MKRVAPLLLLALSACRANAPSTNEAPRRDSCASCHSPKHAFTDASSVSTGIKGQKGGRSAPTVFNRAYSLAQFWDGRAKTLEEQAKGPLANPLEMTGQYGDRRLAYRRKLEQLPSSDRHRRRESYCPCRARAPGE